MRQKLDAPGGRRDAWAGLDIDRRLAIARRTRGMPQPTPVVHLPVHGPLRVTGEPSGLWTDQWVGQVARFELVTTGAIGELCIRGTVPAALPPGQQLCLVAGSTVAMHDASVGPFEWTVALPLPDGAHVAVELLATRAWSPSSGGDSPDTRPLAWHLEMLEGR
jgi:hypothetical protein